MHYNRKKFEHLILVSPLFSLDRDSEYTAFKRESYRMVEYLYCYLLAIDKKKYEPYGCEITEVAIRCINNFDAEKGLFLHYFNAAWKKEYSHILGEKIQEDQYRGLRIPETDRRAVRNYIQLAERLEQQTTSNELYQKLSDAMELPLDRIMELAELSKLNVCGDCCKHSKGGERSIWEQIPGGEYAGYNIETTEELEAILDRIERAFQSLQARQKPIISDMITIKICSFLTKSTSKKFSFLSTSVMEEWMQHGTTPTQREIAKKYGRDEASISRTLRNFLKKIREEK